MRKSLGTADAAQVSELRQQVGALQAQLRAAQAGQAGELQVGCYAKRGGVWVRDDAGEP